MPSEKLDITMWRIIKCDRACTTCDKTQYNEAKFRDRLCLVLHLIFCKSCREYVRNNRELTKHVDSKLKKLHPEVKSEMQYKIEAELKKTSQT